MSDSARPAPSLDADAYHGLLGDIVRSVGPHTEADPVGVLVSLLTMFGASVGAGPHAIADGALHPPRLHAVLVGDSSKGRKGTATAQARRFLEVADPQFAANRVLGGFGSGEVLIDHVADPDEEGTGGDDKRLLVVEAEFARLLKSANRDGSTLSPILREAWDGGRLAARSRQRTTVATGAHICMIGHTTGHELRRHLTETDQVNGFANRVLLAFVRRQKLLPHGGNLGDDEVHDLGMQLGDAIRTARQVRRLRRSVDADHLWTTLYQEMADDDPGGLLGPLVARPEAQTLRLSVTYALVDGSPTIEPDHLLAAWAVWSYCRATAEYVFADAAGDVIADRLLAALRSAGPAGLDFTQQSAVFGRNVSKTRLDAARDLLLESGRIVNQQEETGGRPRTISRFVDESTRMNEGTGLASSVSFPSFGKPA